MPCHYGGEFYPFTCHGQGQGAIGGASLLRVVYFRLCQDLVSEVAAQVLGSAEINLAPFEAEKPTAER